MSLMILGFSVAAVGIGLLRVIRDVEDLKARVAELERKMSDLHVDLR